MGLDAVRAVDDQNGVIQHPKSTLHLCGEVHMTWGVQKGYLPVSQVKLGLAGEDSDAPGPLQAVSIQMSVSVIHTADPANGTALIEDGLGQSCLPGVHVRQDSDGCSFFHSF